MACDGAWVEDDIGGGEEEEEETKEETREMRSR
jgi:hypothetical protein